MADEAAPIAAARAISTVPTATELFNLRTNFVHLIQENANYFGTMPQLKTPIVTPLSGNTAYEAISCLGLNPQAELLEAVVNLRQNTGYLGNACTAGSTEYVRFFVEQGTTWVDLGVASFSSYDIAGSLPLSYSLSVPLVVPEEFCGTEQILNVRAILSWNWAPPAGNATWTPVWGNVVNARVQIAPRWLPIIITGPIKTALTAAAPVPQPAPTTPLGYEQLKTLYASTTVPASRFGLATAIAAPKPAAISAAAEPATAITAAPSALAHLATPIAAAPIAAAPIAAAPIAAAPIAAAPSTVAPIAEQAISGAELAALAKAIEAINASTQYEELTCAGYNPSTGFLEAVISIKLDSGYSGNLCTLGSNEYVGFWVEIGGSWMSLGVASVEVHDLAAVSAGPIEYAVVRAANLPPETCQSLAGLPLRAILSWNQVPTGPTFVPTWGNVLNTFVQPPVGAVTSTQGHNVELMRIGGITTNSISSTTGRATTPAVPISGDNASHDSPFGGVIYVEGYITNELSVFDPVTGDVVNGQNPLKYQVFWNEVSPTPGPATQLVNTFTVQVWPENDMTPGGVTQSIQAKADSNGQTYYTYMEGPTQPMNPRTLAVWYAGGLAEGLYQLTVTASAFNGTAYAPTNTQTQLVYVYNGYPYLLSVEANGIVQQISVQEPDTQLAITSGSGDCSETNVGSTVSGTFGVTDHFFDIYNLYEANGYTLGVIPITVGGVEQIPPAISVNITSAPTTDGVAGTWQLDTTGMVPCGYTIVLSCWDRSVVNSAGYGHYNQTAVGFCLTAAPDEAK